MIAIPNMDKPKKVDGIKIDFHFEDGHIESHIIDIEKIIDIVTCEECKYWHDDGIMTTCDRHIGHGFPSDYFCADGERRSE